MLTHYYTVKKTGSHEIVIQKSRFIGHIARVETEEAAQQFIQDIKKQHYNATHNCSAYIIGDHDQMQKANDDGEPGGTAGVPMLEVLKKLSLKNTVIVATRYFGGIKLGAGGLIRAYSSITSETIKQTGIIQGELMQGFSMTIAYPLLGKVENTLRQSAHIIKDIHYSDQVEFIIYTHIDNAPAFPDEMIDLTNDQLKLKQTDQKYIETDVHIN